MIGLYDALRTLLGAIYAYTSDIVCIGHRGLIRLDEDTSVKIALCGLLGVAAMERRLAAILAADAQGGA